MAIIELLRNEDVESESDEELTPDDNSEEDYQDEYLETEILRPSCQ